MYVLIYCTEKQEMFLMYVEPAATTQHQEVVNGLVNMFILSNLHNN